MTKIPPIDLTPLLDLLKKEGDNEIAKATKTGTLGSFPMTIGIPRIYSEWNTLLSEVEKIVKMLAKGGDYSSFVPHVNKLLESACALSTLASQVLSFVPGPIGIVCSLLNAILCFCRGDIIGGLLELLGCIPGGKFATKGVVKFAPRIEQILLRIVGSNQELMKILKESKEIKSAFGKFIEKVKPQGKSWCTNDVMFNTEKQTQIPKQCFSMQNNPYSIFNKKIGSELSLGKTMEQGQLKQLRDTRYGTWNYYTNNPLHPYPPLSNGKI